MVEIFIDLLLVLCVVVVLLLPLLEFESGLGGTFVLPTCDLLVSLVWSLVIIALGTTLPVREEQKVTNRYPACI